MEMIKNITKLSKMAVKLEDDFDALHPKHNKAKARLIKRALKIQKQLTTNVSKMFPLKTKEEAISMAEKQIDWMRVRVQTREGRITQNPVSRTERRRAVR